MSRSTLPKVSALVAVIASLRSITPKPRNRSGIQNRKLRDDLFDRECKAPSGSSKNFLRRNLQSATAPGNKIPAHAWQPE
jgi:hypothetical protein